MSCSRFLNGLKANNNREWFEAHRADCEAHLLEPASRERPGYFFRLTAESLTLGAGMHGFSDAELERYRKAFVDPVMGSRHRKRCSRTTYPTSA